MALLLLRLTVAAGDDDDGVVGVGLLDRPSSFRLTTPCILPSVVIFEHLA